MMKIIGLIISTLLFTTLAFATKVVPLPNLLKPGLIRLDENQMYITEEANIYIYSLKDFHLVKKFGKPGEGPQEFMVAAGVVGQMWIEIQPDHIFIHTMGKISTFSKQGTFIKEKKISLAYTAAMHPIGNRIVGTGFSTEKGVRYWTTNIYDAHLKIIKEVYPNGTTKYKEILEVNN